MNDGAMNKWLSVYLDAWRVFAASIVFVWHTSNGFFSDGSLYRSTQLSIRANHLAVIIFFVLSGFLIDRSAGKPNNTFSKYLLDRCLRIYSVTIPAIILTIVVGGIVAICETGPAYPAYSQSYMPLRYLINALNLQQIWFFCVVPGANSPFWSLSYEFWYYVALAIVVFFPKRQMFFGLTVIAIVTGPKIALLAPAWAAGVVAHRIYKKKIQVSRIFALPLFALTLVIIAAMLFASLPYDPWRDMKIEYPLYYSSIAFPDFLFAIVVAANIVSIDWIWGTGLHAPRSFRPAAKLIRFFSARTFSLYLYHLPLMFLVGSLLSYDKTDVSQVVLVSTTVFAGCFGLAELTECRMPSLKKHLRKQRELIKSTGVAAEIERSI